MDHTTTNEGHMALGIFGFVTSINLIAIFDRGLVSFALSCCVSVLAIIYYIKNIRKMNREEKKAKKTEQ